MLIYILKLYPARYMSVLIICRREVVPDLGIPMHELFLTAHIGEEDCPRALQILQGYCAMSPTPILRRRLYWNGALVHNRGLDQVFITAQGQKARFWSSLHEQLIRQAYTVLLLYDVTRDQFPKVDTPAEEIP